MIEKQKILPIIRKAVNAVCNLIIGGVILIVTIFLIRGFLFETYKIPSLSMYPTLIKGDDVLVNKLVLGPRVFKNLNFLSGDTIQMVRLPGWRDVKRNDVLVFNLTHYSKDRRNLYFRDYYIKRCIAIPGDTLRIHKGYYSIAGVQGTPGSMKRQEKVSHIPDSMIASPGVRALNGWNIKEFGPLYIPRKGDRIRVTPDNVRAYQRIIEYESQKRLRYDSTGVSLGRYPITSFTFAHDYFFMAGDNAMDSRDSRYWGLLPDEFIIGKAVCVLWSKDKKTGEFQWRRFLNWI